MISVSHEAYAHPGVELEDKTLVRQHAISEIFANPSTYYF